jgi:hypothetical protein
MKIILSFLDNASGDLGISVAWGLVATAAAGWQHSRG